MSSTVKLSERLARLSDILGDGASALTSANGTVGGGGL